MTQLCAAAAASDAAATQLEAAVVRGLEAAEAASFSAWWRAACAATALGPNPSPAAVLARVRTWNTRLKAVRRAQRRTGLPTAAVTAQAGVVRGARPQSQGRGTHAAQASAQPAAGAQVGQARRPRLTDGDRRAAEAAAEERVEAGYVLGVPGEVGRVRIAHGQLPAVPQVGRRRVPRRGAFTRPRAEGALRAALESETGGHTTFPQLPPAAAVALRSVGGCAIMHAKAFTRFSSEREEAASAWRAAMWVSAMPTATSSRSCRFVSLWTTRGKRVRVVELSPMQLAAALGFTGSALERIRVGMAACSRSVGLALLGQAVEAHSARAVVETLVSDLPGAGELRYGEGNAGISTVGAVVEQIVGSRFRFCAAHEISAPVLKVHRAIWQGTVERVQLTTHRECDQEAAKREPPLDLLVLALDCRPLSKANRRARNDRRRRKREAWRMLREARAALRLVSASRARRVAIETGVEIAVEGGLAYAALRRLEGALGRTTGYKWQLAVVDPVQDLGATAARRRAWFLGWRQ